MNRDDRIDEAARWLAEQGDRVPHPVIPTLRKRFALSAGEAVEAIRRARDRGFA